MVWWLPIARRREHDQSTSSSVPGTQALQERRFTADLDTDARTFTRTEQRRLLGSPVLVDLRRQPEVSPVHPRRRGTPGLALLAPLPPLSA